MHEFGPGRPRLHAASRERRPSKPIDRRMTGDQRSHAPRAANAAEPAAPRRSPIRGGEPCLVRAR
jgi:hypothetical protein